MWYVICAGVGLAIGVGFLFWALRERGLRMDLESKLATSATQIAHLMSKLAAQEEYGAKLRDQVDRIDKQGNVLRQLLFDARDKLQACTSVASVRNWLDTEFAAKVL